MFGLGFWETVIIVIVALIFIGPNKLPEVARTLGRGLSSVRRAMAGLQREVDDLKRFPLGDDDDEFEGTYDPDLSSRRAAATATARGEPPRAETANAAPAEPAPEEPAAASEEAPQPVEEDEPR